jgi:hypothetical protein
MTLGGGDRGGRMRWGSVGRRDEDTRGRDGCGWRRV